MTDEARVSFTRLRDMTKEDMDLLNEAYEESVKTLPDELLEALGKLSNYNYAQQVTELEHSLQCATRAKRDGQDDDYVAMALLHDVIFPLAPHSHGPAAAVVFRPFFDERLCWILEKHEVFQAYYTAHLDNHEWDPNARDKYRDHPYYNDCVEFCEKYDQPAFDPSYDSLPLSDFEPLLRRVFTQPPRPAWAATD
jgi:predicted HD phosphohydrolase